MSLRDQAAPPSDPPSTYLRFQSILESWRGRLSTGTLNQLSRQLSYLLQDEEDLAELSGVVDPRSFEALLSYLATHPWIKTPALTLTLKGAFVANWRPTSNAKARLSVDFLDDQSVRWSAVDAREAGVRARLAGGICPLAELDAHLRLYLPWVRL